jgi:hypothetical protein
MSLRDLRPLLAIAVVGVLWALTQSVEGIDVGWLSLAPAFLLALPLLAGRYVGEDALARLASPPRTEPRAATPSIVPPRGRTTVRVGGGLLLARRLAGRAPPRAACVG